MRRGRSLTCHICVATQKKTDQGANDKYHYSVSEMQGWRISKSFSHQMTHSWTFPGSSVRSWRCVSVY